MNEHPMNAEAMRLAEQPALTDAQIGELLERQRRMDLATMSPEEIRDLAERMAAALNARRNPQPAGMMTVEAHQRIVAEAVAQAYEKAKQACDEVAGRFNEELEKPESTGFRAQLYEGMWGGAMSCAAAIFALKEAS